MKELTGIILLSESLVQVQGTNDSSIVSKRSMVQQGYADDPFLKVRLC